MINEGNTIDSRLSVLESEQRSHVKRCEELDLKRDADRASLVHKVEEGFEMMHSRFNTLKQEMNNQSADFFRALNEQERKFSIAIIGILVSALVGALWYIVTHQGT